MESAVINWNLCFLCQQRKKKDDCRSTKEGLEKLSKLLPEFQKVDGLPFHLDSITGNHDDLEDALTKESAKYHKKCYNDYNTYKLEL